MPTAMMIIMMIAFNNSYYEIMVVIDWLIYDHDW